MSNKRPRPEEKDGLVSQFCAITGASEEVGQRMLEACNNDLQMAIGMQLDVGERGGGDASRDDLGDLAATALPSSSNDPEAGADVRAPIPQHSEVLVSDAPNFGWRNKRRAARSVFDAFRDFQAEAKQQEEQQQGAVPSTSAPTASKRKTLEDLFRPPIDLLHKGSFQSAKESGTSRNKWLLVNIQNVKEFSCQMLNRDVWSNRAVKDIIKNGFIFWQVYHDSEEGQKYTQFYKVSDWPYIAILDPITGENLAVWTKLDAKSLCDLLAEFLCERPSPDGSPTGPATKKPKRNSIVDASEDSQMEAAIQASLQETHQQPDDLLDFDSPEDTTEDEGSDDLETFTDSEDSESARSPADKTPRKNTVQKTSQETDSSQDSVSANILKKQSKSQGTSTKSKSCGEKRTQNGVTPSSSRSSTPSSKTSVAAKNSWKDFLGCDEDSNSNILLRFPDGKREQFKVPHSSKLQALVLFAAEKGFPSDRYELMTNFPKRNLLSLDRDITLKEAELFPQETVFIHER